MRSIILCEGLDDLWLFGYLIHKWSGKKWEYNSKGKISPNYSFPTSRENEKFEVYLRGSDTLGIWAVGSKDAFLEPLGKIDAINRRYQEDFLENIVIISDRDQNDVTETLSQFDNKLSELGLSVRLVNNSKNKITYTANDENYDVYIYPIIIPFDEKGALETVLMTALANDSGEDAYIVERAKNYVLEVQKSGKATSYLKHQREKLKAEFSSVISIMNPTRSTATLDKLLMSHNWDEYDYIKDHFKLLREIFA